MMSSEYKDVIVKKPWGFEYLCYQNNELAIWFLRIEEGKQTSFHCHPNKNTGFIVLSGEVELSFMRNTQKLSALDKIHIFRARFHSTKAISENGALILEIETPEDKRDLVRLEDKYGREGESYEGKSFEFKKDESCIWIPEPNPENSYINIGGVELGHIKPDVKEELYGNPDTMSFIVTRGGIETDGNQRVIWPGDVIDGFSLEKLLRPFNLMSGTTMIAVK